MEAQEIIRRLQMDTLIDIFDQIPANKRDQVAEKLSYYMADAYTREAVEKCRRERKYHAILAGTINGNKYTLALSCAASDTHTLSLRSMPNLQALCVNPNETRPFGSRLGKKIAWNNIAKFNKLLAIEIHKCPMNTIDKLPRGLRRLILNDCPQLRFISAIGQCVDLEHLEMHNVAPWNHEFITSLKNLRTLICRESVLFNIRYFTGLTMLTKLDISENQVETLDGIANCPQLREINLADNPITSLRGLSSLPHLYKLGLSGCSLIIDISELTYCSKLRELDISRTFLESPFAKLSECPLLQKIDYSYNRPVHCAELNILLDCCHKLKQINLRGTSIHGGSINARPGMKFMW